MMKIFKICLLVMIALMVCLYDLNFTITLTPKHEEDKINVSPYDIYGVPDSVTTSDDIFI